MSFCGIRENSKSRGDFGGQEALEEGETYKSLTVKQYICTNAENSTKYKIPTESSYSFSPYPTIHICHINSQIFGVLIFVVILTT